MFWNKKRADEIEKVKSRLSTLEASTAHNAIKDSLVDFYKEFFDYKKRQESDKETLKKDLSKWADDFEKNHATKNNEFIEKLFDFTKDTAMLAVLSKMDGNSFSALKRDLMMPEIKKSWAEAEKKQGEAVEESIKTKGELILKKKKELEEKVLELERTNKPSDTQKAQLEILKLFVTCVIGLFLFIRPAFAVNQKIDANGNAWVSMIPRTGTAALTSASINVSASGQTALVAGVSSQTTKVYRLFIVAATATTVKFQDGNTDLCAPMSLAANEGIVLDFDGEPWFTTSANTAFNINLGSAVQVSGRVYYVTS